MRAFPASKIASALGKARPQIARSLANTPHEEGKSRGVAARCYRVDDLPFEMKAEIHAKAHSLNTSADRLVETPPMKWRPACPEILPKARKKAESRRDTLAPLVRNRGEMSILALAKKAATRATTIDSSSERTLRRIITRAIERDAGLEDWDRWEIWIDEAYPSRAHCAAADVETSSATIDQRAGCDSAERSREDIAIFAVHRIADLMKSGKNLRTAKAEVATQIESSFPNFSTSRASLLKILKNAWKNGMETAGTTPH